MNILSINYFFYFTKLTLFFHSYHIISSSIIDNSISPYQTLRWRFKFFFTKIILFLVCKYDHQTILTEMELMRSILIHFILSHFFQSDHGIFPPWIVLKLLSYRTTHLLTPTTFLAVPAAYNVMQSGITSTTRSEHPAITAAGITIPIPKEYLAVSTNYHWFYFFHVSIL